MNTDRRKRREEGRKIVTKTRHWPADDFFVDSAEDVFDIMLDEEYDFAVSRDWSRPNAPSPFVAAHGMWGQARVSGPRSGA